LLRAPNKTRQVSSRAGRCIFAVVLQIAGAAWIASTCGTGAAAITMAAYGQPFKRKLNIKRIDE